MENNKHNINIINFLNLLNNNNNNNNILNRSFNDQGGAKKHCSASFVNELEQVVITNEDVDNKLNSYINTNPRISGFLKLILLLLLLLLFILPQIFMTQYFRIIISF